MSAEVFIPLTHGKVAVVDFVCFGTVRGFNWRAEKSGRNFYAVRTSLMSSGPRRKIYMHKEILRDTLVDHIDGDGLNNRLCNLRPATHTQNCCSSRLSLDNTSGFKGVSRRHDVKKWVSHIRVEGVLKHLGFFDAPEEAARAYDCAAKIYFGEFARFNFPESRGINSINHTP